MTVDQVIEYYSVSGNRRGAQARWAEDCGRTPTQISQIVRRGKIPTGMQFELQVRSRGVLVANAGSARD